jgi:broad specificity phosphatase PhoE
MTNSEIWLVRHGETEWSRTGQHTGRTDLPLTERGREEARAVAHLLKESAFDRVLVSPLRRAVETCEIAGFNGRARVEPDAMEWDYGELNGLTRAEIKQIHGPGWTIWRGPVPGGETLEDVAARASRVLAALPGGRTVIFAHGHFLRILTAVYLGLPPEAAKHFALATARISILGEDYGHPAVVRWNAA